MARHEYKILGHISYHLTLQHHNSNEISRRRGEILSAVAFSSSVLLKSANWKDALNPALERLGKAALANRAYYFENHTAEDGAILTSQVAEWVADGVESQFGNPELKGFPYVEAGFGRWPEIFNQRKPIHGLISSFPAAERTVLEAQGIQSLVGMPVFSQEKLVGFLGFDDCESLRQWSSAELDALSAAATALGAAIERHHLEHQLRFAQKMEAIGCLASGVAHDFNNMLQVIVGFTTLAKLKLAADDSAHDELDEVLAATSRAHSLTGQLLSFSRKQDSKPQNLSLKDVCESVVTMIKPTLNADIQLSVDLPDSDLMVFADVSSFTQVLLNLCLNAHDAMPQGGQLNVKVTARHIEQNPTESHSPGRAGHFACISISDTGCGIGDDIKERIFEPFFTTKGAGQGTGLGLSMAYGTVQKLGGFIEVCSARNEGSQFQVYMPLTELTHRDLEQVQSVEAGTEAILLVDDEPMILQSTRLLLQAAGYRVLVAENGMKGLEVFNEYVDDVSLVLSDFAMPAMDGATLINAVLDIKPQLKAILISGNPESASRLLDHKNVAIIQKPVTNQMLQLTIRRMLG